MVLQSLKQNTVDWITPEIAIGDWGVQYSDLWKDPFTLIIDVANDLAPIVPCYYFPLGYDEIKNRDLMMIIRLMNVWLFENDWKEKRKIIVHCMAGYERSPLVVATFLVNNPKALDNLDEAYKLIKTKRDVADCRSWIVY